MPMNNVKEKANSISKEDGSKETLEGSDKTEKPRKDALKFDGLKFIRITDPAVFQLIPRQLFNQIKDLDSEAIDRLYEYGSSILTQVVPNEQGQLIRVANPLVHIAVLVDKQHKIKGFVWLDFDIIDQSIFVQQVSVVPEYQSNKGQLLRQVRDYVFDLPIPNKFKQKICWETTRPKAFERQGWKRSEKVSMEFIREG